MDLEVTGVGLYTNAQSCSQFTNSIFLGLVVSGLETMNIYTPEGKFCGEAHNGTLFLLPPGFRLDFRFNSRRENYVAMCRSDAVQRAADGGAITLRLDSCTVAVPPVLAAAPGDLERLRSGFRRLLELHHSPLPRDAEAARMLATGLMAEFAAGRGREAEEFPPEVRKLKQAIDGDPDFRKPIRELYAGCGRSAVHLRRLFRRYCLITPSEYRARLRLARIQELLREGDWNLKEIADAAGMRNVTHLCAFIRKRCGTTPARLRNDLRL